MPSNPIARFELIRAARQPQHYMMRAAAWAFHARHRSGR